MISAKKNNFIVEYRPSSIRAARISSATAPAVVESLLEIDLDGEADVADKVRDFCGAKGNAYMHAACSVYPDQRLVRQIVLDAPRGKEADFVLTYLRETVGVDPDEFSTYCLSAQDGTDADLSAFNKKNVLLCGAPKPSVVEVQNRLVDSAIYPDRLEIGTIGIIGALRDMLGAQEGSPTMLFLEIDTDSTNAVIVGEQGVEMARCIDCGARQIASALKEEMNLKDESAAERILLSKDFDLGPIAPKILRKLIRELQSSIGFFEVQSGSSVSQLFCLKQGRSLPWLQASVCELLNLEQLSLSLSDWLASRQLSFASEELTEKLDGTWVGIFSLALELGKGEPSS